MSAPEEPLKGMYPILATPFHDDESIDFPSLERLIDYCIGEGADGLVTLANASEGHCMSDAEKERLAAAVIAHVDSRVPVVISISHFSAKIAAEKAQWSEREGASAVMSLPPFFGKWKSDAPTIRTYLSRIGENISISLILQDHPLTDITLTAAELIGLAETVPHLDYFKMEVDTSPVKVRKVLTGTPDTFKGIFTGMGGIRLYWELEAGAVGCMPACIPAKALADIIHLYFEGKREEAFAVFQHWLPFIDFLLRLGRRDAVKEYLVDKGVIDSAVLREPNITAWNDWCRKEFLWLVERLEG